MKDGRLWRWISWGVVAMVDVFLFAAIFILMNFVQGMLQEDVRINLTEIVTQNKNLISGKLSMEISELDLVANQLVERYHQEYYKDDDTLEKVFQRYAVEKDADQLFLATTDGVAVFPDGKEVNIAGRKYFQLAMQGEQNVSERILSRVDGMERFMVSVPVVSQGEIIATVQKQYLPEQMYEICEGSLFSEHGYVYIINKEGYILLNSDQDQYMSEADNYYRLLYLDNAEKAMQLEDDIKNGRDGFMEVNIKGQPIFLAYTPVETIYDWYLISGVDTAAVSPNAHAVIKLFYGVLLMVAIFFSFSAFYYLCMKRKQSLDLERAVFADSVTGGCSYAKFLFDLPNILKKDTQKQWYLFVFDIDNFKYINSVYGFDAGDRILRGVRKAYASKLAEDEMIARIYGDHFVMLISDASNQRLEKLYCAELDIDGLTVYLAAGLYAIEDIHESLNLMVDKATMAARTTKGFRYKQIGLYSEEVGRDMQQNEETKRAVEQALERGEIIAYYQPKVDINTGQLVGAEALARWQREDGALISPANFIPICEKTGLIVAVDMAVFEHTLGFLRRQLDHGVACVPISVNFSRLHLLNQGFLETVLEKMETYQVPTSLIELELTETVLFDNYQTVADLIERMHESGLQIAMDDFGSGYSSLHMLKDMEIDILKIDRGFLQETAESYRQEAVFASIAQMAEKLRIKVVVEGVETMDNINLMREYGCAIAQGYFYAKPMPEEVFEKIYQQGMIE